MPLSFYRDRRWVSGLGASLAVIAISASAQAGISIPALEIYFQAGDDKPLVFNPDGSHLGGDIFSYAGETSHAGANLSWSLLADPDPFVSGQLAVENATLVDMNVSLIVTLPVDAIDTATLIGGSAAISVTTTSDGGTFSSLGGDPIWQALMDGSSVASLFDDPYEISIAGLGSDGDEAAFGTPIPSMAGPSVSETIGIEITFTLSPGTQASLTSVFVVIPGPGGLAVLALAGVVTRRRRRSN